MADPLTITLHESAAETESGSAAAVDLWGDDDVETRRVATLSLAISAISGSSPALVVTVQTSDDGASWSTVEAFASKSAVGTTAMVTGDFLRYARCSWTLAGGGSATFALTGTAIETWCTLAELAQFGTAATALAELSKADRLRHLMAATKVAHGYIVRRHCPPIIRVGEDVTQAVAKLASLSLLTDVRGLNPNVQATELAIAEARAKEAWLVRVSKGVAGADVTDSTPDTSEGSGYVVTGTSRGWGTMSVV